MKRPLITIAAVLTLAVNSWANPDHLETGTYKTTNGKTIVITYVVGENQYKEVYLILPDGKTIPIAVQPGTTVETLDKALIKLMEKL